jgi:hypothetical protein
LALTSSTEIFSTSASVKGFAPKRGCRWQAAGWLDEFFDALVDDLVNCWTASALPCVTMHGLTGRQVHQFKQRLEAGDIPVFRALQVLEILEVGNGRGRETGKAGGVELRAGDGEHAVAIIDQRRQRDADPDGFKAVFVRQHELDARLKGGDDFRPVDDLPLAFGFEDGQDVFGVAGL